MSNNYNIARTVIDEFTEMIEVTPIHSDTKWENLFQAKFYQYLNDFKLRQIVADETRDIKTILYAKAFAEDEELSEDDIHD